MKTTNSKSKKFNLSIEFSIGERKFLLVAVDSLLLFFSIFIYYNTVESHMSLQYFLLNNYIGIIYGLILFWVLSYTFNLYNLEICNTTRKILPLVFFIGILFTTVFILTPILTPKLPSKRIYLVGFVFSFTMLLAIWRIFYTYVINSPTFFKEIIVLVFGDYEEVFLNEVKSKIEGKKYNNGYRIKRFYFIPRGTKRDKEFKRMFDRIIT